MLDELFVPNPGVSRPAQITRRLMQSNGIPEASGKRFCFLSKLFHNVNLNFCPAGSSPETNAGLSFDMNTTPKLVALTSLFDIFTYDGHMMGEFSDINNMLLEDTMNDSLFGFMDNNCLPEAFNWS
jgi:hypothetical protein